MKMNVISHHCHVLADGTVIPDPGYEGPRTEQGPFRGSCSFDWIEERGTEPHLIVARPSVVPVVPGVAVAYNSTINFAYFDWSYWHDATNAWIDVDREIVIGTNGPAAMPMNSYHIDTGTLEDPPLTGNGLVDPFATTIRGLAFTMLDPANNNGWKIRRIYAYRWKGQANNPADAPYGKRNVRAPATMRLQFEIWKRTYTDVAFPGATSADSFHEFKTYTINTAGGSTAQGVPSAVSFGGFTTAEINTFAQLAVADAWPQVIYPSNNLAVHYWIKAVSFTAA